MTRNLASILSIGEPKVVAPKLAIGSVLRAQYCIRSLPRFKHPDDQRPNFGVLEPFLIRSNRLFLTLLGGGALRNDEDWIGDAMLRALQKYRDHELDFAVAYNAP